jgi:SAM-dependent methyltransferase
MNCPVCNCNNEPSFDKGGVDYHLCQRCDTCYSVALPNANMIGGVAEIERRNDNAERVRRFRMYSCESLLDFGCGHGWLVEDARNLGVTAFGYDKYSEDFTNLPIEQVDVVSMIEVIEHTVAPFNELNEVWDCLKPGGHVYIETSFTDIGRSLIGSVDHLGNEVKELKDFFYISPQAGHSTIFSHRSLDMLMISKGFKPLQHINPTVRIYQK